MKKPTTISKESVSEYREFVQLRLRKRVLEAIEVVLEEEVNQALGVWWLRACGRPPWISQRSRNPSRDDVGGNSRAPGATSPRARRGNGRNDRVRERAVAPVRAPDS